MRLTKTRAVVAAVVLSLGVAACGGGNGDSGGDGGEGGEVEVSDSPEFPEGSTMATLADAGAVTVGTKFDQPGFGLQNLEGVPEGFDVKIAELLAANLGIDPEDITWRESPSAERENLIESGDVDMVVATYTINDERAERVTFAGPYYTAGQQLMVLSDNDTITGPDDLKDNPDMKVCSVDGSTPAENIKEYLADPGQLVTFDVYERCADSLSNGQVDVVTTDNVILLGFVAESDGEFKLVGEQFTEEPYGVGIKKGDTEFCEWINETLADNEDAYLEAWNSTAGEIEGTQDPEFPDPAPCV